MTISITDAQALLIQFGKAVSECVALVAMAWALAGRDLGDEDLPHPCVFDAKEIVSHIPTIPLEATQVVMGFVTDHLGIEYVVLDRVSGAITTVQGFLAGSERALCSELSIP